ncbi:4-(cytidine 5'-diphospho)-2-C-methyl-D-erythritol kinase [Sphingobacterium hotanense]|uniref:4-diphosphocytidyl-2-C-methyl-D-erythritol kinase n=1 Tax=Sphingobacterium hotanense TaxID=649196 RepID=A0ABT7NLH5_9SPHI|nr:4-(cytidine 5'-diphospho)-2-C-methyl-D-erythritol kinase [Sphingobacterium hotanense]MDM1048006.1 4-(cytidine 5'-diphospho)-2-C-methyl-D-erythritol kinase [Sphingobacterium hotanense]
MLKFANAKINIGLHITERRSDGYHNLETIFYPVKIYDAVETQLSDKLELEIHGANLKADDDNLCLKAYRLLAADYDLPPLKIHLLKRIPIGAGLGGGSSDASATLQLLNEQFELGISDRELEQYAAQLGADCPFFIQNKSTYAEDIGTKLSEIELDLSDYYIVILKPNIHISTAEAYKNVTPLTPQIDLRRAVQLPIQEWKLHIKNDFEAGLFELYPQIGEIKRRFYELGAVYSSMTGSGSAVFGIFEQETDVSEMTSLGKIFLPMDL